MVNCHGPESPQQPLCVCSGEIGVEAELCIACSTPKLVEGLLENPLLHVFYLAAEHGTGMPGHERALDLPHETCSQMRG